MGDCASRPTTKEIEKHTQQTNTINDSYFTALPYIDFEIQNQHNPIILNNKRKIYAKKGAEYQKLLSKFMTGFSGVPQLNVEIQKGLNFWTQTNCVNRGKPFIVAALEPNGPVQETFVSDAFKPYWYRLLQFKQNYLNYTHIVVRVMLERRLGNNIQLGFVRFQMKDLQDQMLREGWYTLEGCQGMEENPRLRIRLQLVYDRRAMLLQLKNLCNERLKRIDQIRSVS